MNLICPFDNKILISYFDSVSSMSNIQIPKVNMALYRSSCLKSIGSNSYWYGCSGVAEVKRISELMGWPDGVKKGKELMDTIKLPNLPSIKRKLRWGSTGHTLNLNRLYSGQCDRAWLGTKKNLSAKKIVRGKTNINLVINIGTTSGVSSESYFWRGALGCVLAKTLQDSGYNVRILAVDSTVNCTVNDNVPGSKNFTAILNVKNYGDRIEYNKLFAVTALVGFYRYYFFKSTLALNTKITSGLGRPIDIDPDILDPFLDKNTLLLIENIWDKESALKKAKNLIESM